MIWLDDANAAIPMPKVPYTASQQHYVLQKAYRYACLHVHCKHSPNAFTPQPALEWIAGFIVSLRYNKQARGEHSPTHASQSISGLLLEMAINLAAGLLTTTQIACQDGKRSRMGKEAGWEKKEEGNEAAA